jgi:hypothetical protein
MRFEVKKKRNLAEPFRRGGGWGAIQRIQNVNQRTSSEGDCLRGSSDHCETVGIKPCKLVHHIL